MKLTPKRARYLIKDEAKATKEYHALGLHSLAKDEARHRRVLQKKLKCMEKKKSGKKKKKK